MLGGMVSLCSLAMCLRTISEYRKRSPQMRQCHWSREKMYGRHSELFGSSFGSGILVIHHNPKSTIDISQIMSKHNRARQRTGHGPDDPGCRTIGVPGNNIAPFLGVTRRRPAGYFTFRRTAQIFQECDGVFRDFRRTFIPTRASWLNQIEIWFSILADQSLARVSFNSVVQLRSHIDAFIEDYNEHAKPFAWTKSEAHQKRLKARFADQ